MVAAFLSFFLFVSYLRLRNHGVCSSDQAPSFVKNFIIVTFLLSHALTVSLPQCFLRAGQAVNFGAPENYFRQPCDSNHRFISTLQM